MILVDRSHLKEIFTADEDDMDFLSGAVEDADFSHSFRTSVFQKVHSRAIRVNLNHNIPAAIPEIVEELHAIFKEEFESIGEGFSLRYTYI
jgi:hypothetical protein